MLLNPPSHGIERSPLTLEEWLAQFFQENAPADVLSQGFHLPHLLTLGSEYGKDSPRIAFIGAEAALSYCGECNSGGLACDHCRKKLPSSKEAPQFLRDYWSHTLHTAVPAAYGARGVRNDGRIEENTAFWRGVHLAASALLIDDFQTPSSTTDWIRGHPDIFRKIAWGNLYKFSYMWESQETETARQLSARNSAMQLKGAQLLSLELKAAKPDIIVLMTPPGTKFKQCLSTALHLLSPALSERVEGDWWEWTERWRTERGPQHRTCYSLQDQSENTFPLPVVVQPQHPRSFPVKNLLSVIAEARELWEMSR